MTVAAALAIVLAYLIGSIPFSFLLAKILGGVDIRKVGSGNVGAANLARSLGLGKGIAGLLLDAAKGVAAVLLARLIAGGGAPGLPLEPLAGGMAVIGHMYTPFLGFKGGKGVATGAGVFGVLAPRALLVAVAVFAIVLLLSRLVSLGSVLAAASLPLAAHGFGADRAITWAAILIGALVIGRHRDNLVRIAQGRESRIGTAPPSAKDDR